MAMFVSHRGSCRTHGGCKTQGGCRTHDGSEDSYARPSTSKDLQVKAFDLHATTSLPGK